MRNELTEALTNITQIDLIQNMLLNMNNKDLFKLLSLLNYTDKDTQERWLTTYQKLIKF